VGGWTFLVRLPLHLSFTRALAAGPRPPATIGTGGPEAEASEIVPHVEGL
jgi:hypothetical protein